MPAAGLTVATWIERARVALAGEKPVYAGPNLVRIGYYKTGQERDLCRGAVMIYKDAPQNLLSPKDWIVEDGKGNLIFLSQYCVMNNIDAPWLARPDFTVTTPSRRAAAARAAADPVGTALIEAGKEIPWWVWAGAGGLILLGLLRR